MKIIKQTDKFTIIEDQKALPSFTNHTDGKETTRLKLKSVEHDIFAIDVLAISEYRIIAFFQRIHVAIWGGYVKVDENTYLVISDIAERFLISPQEILNTQNIISTLEKKAQELENLLGDKDFRRARWHTQRLYKQAARENPAIFIKYYAVYLKIFDRYKSISHKMIEASSLCQIITKAVEILDSNSERLQNGVIISHKGSKYVAQLVNGKLDIFCLEGERIANGGFGVIEKVKQVSHGRFLAKKTAFREDISREVRIHDHLKDVDGIIDRPKYFAITRLPFITMPFYQANLKECRNKGMSDIKSISCARQLLKTLCLLSERQVFHQDIEPRNILIIENEVGILTKLADWGLAAFKSDYKLGGKRRYTPKIDRISIKHLSPDKIIALRRRKEIFAMGVTIIEMITGKYPFYLNKAFQPLSIRLDVRRKLENWARRNDQMKLLTLLKRMTELDPKKICSIDAIEKYLLA